MRQAQVAQARESQNDVPQTKRATATKFLSGFLTNAAGPGGADT